MSSTSNLLSLALSNLTGIQADLTTIWVAIVGLAILILGIRLLFAAIFSGRQAAMSTVPMPDGSGVSSFGGGAFNKGLGSSRPMNYAPGVRIGAGRNYTPGVDVYVDSGSNMGYGGGGVSGKNFPSGGLPKKRGVYQGGNNVPKRNSGFGNL
jgi:hypothetical protein